MLLEEGGFQGSWSPKPLIQGQTAIERGPMVHILIGLESLWTLKPVGALENLPGNIRENHYQRELQYSPLSDRKAVAL